MTVRATKPAYTEDAQRTQATSYVEQLAQRFKTQAQQNTPRAKSAWSAEQNRLGSWNTGVGTLTSPGVGSSYESGRSVPLFDYNDDDDDRRDR